MKPRTACGLAALLALTLVPASAQDASLFNTEIAVSPWAGEASSTPASSRPAGSPASSSVASGSSQRSLEKA